MREEKQAELYTLLEDDKLDEAVERLKAFSEDEVHKLLTEALMLERVVKAKIRFLRQELIFGKRQAGYT